MTHCIFMNKGTQENAQDIDGLAIAEMIKG